MTGSHRRIGYFHSARELGNPLDFLVEDNTRERGICDLLDQIAQSAAPEAADVTTVITYLKEELPLHLQDENEDLVPLMRLRCKAEDRIDDVITRLHSNHGHAMVDLPAIVSLLGKAAPMSQRTRRMIRNFASHARSHISVENAILLPIARVRLKANDLDKMRRHMLERRGLHRVIG